HRDRREEPGREGDAEDAQHHEARPTCRLQIAASLLDQAVPLLILMHPSVHPKCVALCVGARRGCQLTRGPSDAPRDLGPPAHGVIARVSSEGSDPWLFSRYGLPARGTALAVLCVGGFGSFVTSTGAPTAAGWSDPVAWWGLHPLKTYTFARRTASPFAP